MTTKLRKELNKLLIALGVFAVLMVVDKTGILQIIFAHPLLSRLFYLVPFLMAGFPVLRKALLGVKNRQPFDESFLMTIASLGAFVTGESEEAAAVMLFYQFGEWFQSFAVGKSRGSITELMNIVPEEANVEREDGSVETVDPDDVEVGDTLVIRPGEKIPVDGTVISGESLINTAALTGESVPRVAREGDLVISGCINGEGLLKVRADKEFDDSTVAKILELVENASDKKSRTEKFITRFAKIYTPVVVIAALVLAILPPIFLGNWSTWIYRACTFLVISCPCALVISVPLAFFGGVGAASKNGVLVKGSNYLELLAKLDTIVSDKTGTLTEGNFVVTQMLPAEGVTEKELIMAAAEAEGMSTHPIAGSIREELKKLVSDEEILVEAVDTENVSGQGLIATINGKKTYVGNEKLMQSIGVTPAATDDAAATVVYVAQDGKYLGAILIRDRVKAEAAQAIREIKKEGVKKVVMLTGDRKSVGEAVGKEIGVDSVIAELLPQDKVAQFENILASLGQEDDPNRDRVAFIGDGINDAPVLSRADVGIAMGSLGSDAAIEAADIVIMDDDLTRIAPVIRVARRTVGIARQNILFALIVKVLILILGAMGIANMWAAVFSDVGVAVLCILNSMRLLRVKKTI